MSMTRSVMYLGNKSMKFDNVNGVPERKWNGPGAVVEAITPVQADKLCAHKDEFLDVTGKTDKEIAALAAKARVDSQERVRALHRPDPKTGAVLLEYATNEQIEAELKRRRDVAGIQAAAPPSAPAKPAKGGKKGAEKSKSQVEITNAVEEVIGKLLEKNDGDDFKDGIPTKAAVERELGFSLTDDEYSIALGAQAPAEQPDKTGFSDQRQ